MKSSAAFTVSDANFETFVQVVELYAKTKKYHKQRWIALSSNMQDRESLSVDRIDVSTMFFKQESNFLIASIDSIVQGRKPFIILLVDPLLLAR